MSLELIESFDEARENAVRFNDVQKLISAIHHHRIPFHSFRCWYYFPDANSDIFAPSKFIGYRNTTIDNYQDGMHHPDGTKAKDGRNTEPVLHEWFVKLNPESPEYKRLRKKLDDFAISVGGKISALVDKQANKPHTEGGAGIYVKE